MDVLVTITAALLKPSGCMSTWMMRPTAGIASVLGPYRGHQQGTNPAPSIVKYHGQKYGDCAPGGGHGHSGNRNYIVHSTILPFKL